MNTKALLLSLLLVSPLLSNKDIPMTDLVVHMDKNQLIAELKKRDEWDPKLKMTYVIAGAVVATAAITGATILIVHFHQ